MKLGLPGETFIFNPKTPKWEGSSFPLIQYNQQDLYFVSETEHKKLLLSKNNFDISKYKSPFLKDIVDIQCSHFGTYALDDKGNLFLFGNLKFVPKKIFFPFDLSVKVSSV